MLKACCKQSPNIGFVWRARRWANEREPECDYARTRAHRHRADAQDADDDMVLEAAANGRADAIATFNIRDFAGVASEFGIAVLTPAEILRRL